MDDLISRQAAINMCRKPRMRNADCSDFEMEIMMLPSAGPEIIRCRDCQHRDEHGCCKHWKALSLSVIPIATDDDDFCSYAERKNGTE